MFRFDKFVSREGSYSLKWEKYAGTDILPFWVADMDLPTPPFVLDAVRLRARHPIHGYSTVPDSLTEALRERASNDFGWSIEEDWVVWIPGIVPGMNLALRTLLPDTAPTVAMSPVYPPILRMPTLVGCPGRLSELVLDSGRWVMDFEDLDQKARQAKSLIFCNPQNPTGRMYSRSELLQLADVASRHDLTIISDEIHWGLVLEPTLRHIPIASLDTEIARRTVTFIAATKTYNMAGLNVGAAIIPHAGMRRQFAGAVDHTIGMPSALPMAASEAAYRDRSSWRIDLCEYLRGNRDMLESAVNRIDGLRTTRVEGTHLAWIDARVLGVANPQEHFERFGVGLSDGADFGCQGFVRFNFATPRSLLRTGLERLREAAARA